MSADTTGTGTCSKCGAELDPDSNFCQKCGARVRAKEAARGKATRRRVEPWALKASESVKKISLKVKIGVPLAILVIILIVVALLVLSAMHSPEAALVDYLNKLKQGEYVQAYKQVSKGGVLSESYFMKWQKTLSNELGRLRDFRVVSRSQKNKLFGRLVVEEQANGHQYVVTYVYADKTFDANVTCENAGGAWPLNKYRIRLSDQTTRIFATPLGSSVYVDNQFMGIAKQDKALADALSLKHFPKSVSDAVDYVKMISGAAQGLIDDVRRFLREVDTIGGNVQTAFNKIGKGGVPWSDVVNTLKQTVENSKELGNSVARIAIHLYWTFGGGDDGTLRASLARTEPMVELENLPDGFHLVRVKLHGARGVTKECYAPEDVVIDLKPAGRTENDLKAVMDAFWRERSNAEFTPNGSNLPSVCGGKVLEQESAKLNELAAKGQHTASQMTALEYTKFQLLNRDVAAVDTREVWNFITYQGAVVASTDLGANRKMVYTLKRENGTWKVIEQASQ